MDMRWDRIGWTWDMGDDGMGDSEDRRRGLGVPSGRHREGGVVLVVCPSRSLDGRTDDLFFFFSLLPYFAYVACLRILLAAPTYGQRNLRGQRAGEVGGVGFVIC